MDRNEFITKLQMVYVGDRNALNEIIGVYDNLKEENQKLINVLNEIKIIIDDYYAYDYEDENLERLNVIDKINHIIKESDK